MKIEALTYTTEDVHTRLYPDSYWEEMEKKWPKEIKRFKNPSLAILPAQEINRYSQGIFTFANQIGKALPAEMGSQVTKVMAEELPKHMDNFINQLGKITRDNFRSYFAMCAEASKQPSKATVVTTENIKEFLNKAPVVLLDIWAVWCAPCKALNPIINQIIENNQGGGIAVGKVDLDQNRRIAEKYDVTSVPTLLFFKNGTLKKRLVGMQTLEAIQKELDGLVD